MFESQILQVWTDVLAVAISLIALLVSISSYRRHDQARSLEQAAQVSDLIWTSRASFERVLSLEGRALSEWNEDDRQAAYEMCFRFHFVGVQLHQKMLPEHVVAYTWFYGIPKCHDILQAYVAEMRGIRDERYWSGFDFLAKRVRAKGARFKGFR